MSQLFGMDHIFSKMQDKYDNQVNKKKELNKSEVFKNNFDATKLSKDTASYLEKLKEKYGDAEIVVVGNEQANQISNIASNTKTNKNMVVVLTEDELEKMATDETVRSQNEALIDEAMSAIPDVSKKLEDAGLKVDTLGMEIKDGIVNYFALLGDKEVIATSLDEFMKKLEEILYEKKADSAQTEDEKKVGQSFDFSV